MPIIALACALAAVPAAAGDGTTTAAVVTLRVPMDAGPTGIGSGHGLLWVTRDDDRLVRLDPRTGRERGRTRVGRFPVRVAVGPREAWVADSLGDTVSEVDVRGGRRRRRIRVGDQPSGIAVTDGAVWVVCAGDERLFRIDPRSGRVVQRIRIGPPADDIPDIAAGPAGLWVTSHERVVRIDAVSGAVVASVPVRSPADVAVGGDAVWVADIRADRVTRIDSRSAAVTGTFRAGHGPSGVALALGRVWVLANLDGVLRQLDPRTGRTLGRLRVGAHAWDVAATPDAVWVQSYADLSVLKVQLVRRRASSPPVS